MAITIDGTGSISGISAGGLPDSSVITADIAAGAVTQAKRSEDLTLATAQASTSGTSIDFTGIPSWVKRVTVMFQGVSTNGTSAPIIRLGTSSGFVVANYASVVSRTTASGSSTAGFLLLDVAVAASTNEGLVIISNVSGNAWSYLSNIAISGNSCGSGAGSISSANLGGTLDRIRITTVNGTDTFDAGTINIMYE